MTSHIQGLSHACNCIMKPFHEVTKFHFNTNWISFLPHYSGEEAAPKGVCADTWKLLNFQSKFICSHFVPVLSFRLHGSYSSLPNKANHLAEGIHVHLLLSALRDLCPSAFCIEKDSMTYRPTYWYN